MADIKKGSFLYKNLIGDAQSTINAIQSFLEKNSKKDRDDMLVEEKPAESINRVLESVASDEINADIQSIIKNL